MKSNWTTSLLVLAAMLVLVVSGRLDLLALAAPLSLVVSWIAARASAGRARQRRI